MIEIIDYYSRFEGEPELQFSYSKDESTGLFKIWIGYFDQIMDQILPSDDGWTGLAFFYQMNEGWYNQADWIIPNLEEAISQFENLDLADQQVDKIRQELVNFLLRARSKKAFVKINYF